MFLIEFSSDALFVHRYEGLFNAGKFNGKGIFFYGSLDKYEGDFINGR